MPGGLPIDHPDALPVKKVKLSIDDLRKIINYPGGVDAIDAIVDKLEEIENRMDLILAEADRRAAELKNRIKSIELKNQEILDFLRKNV